jgi:hypothetical protein
MAQADSRLRDFEVLEQVGKGAFGEVLIPNPKP